MLKAEHVTVRYGSQAVVDDLSFHLKEGQWLMLAGPNGAGKSTLINAVSQGVPYSGSVLLAGKDIRSYRPAQLARKIGVSRQTINMIERGDYNPTLKLCIQLCHALGTTLDALFWEEETP